MKRHLAPRLRLAVALLIISLAVFGALAAGTFYLPPPLFDAPLKLIFRIVFWLSLPMIMAVRFFWRDVDHHTQIGALALASLLTPLMYWAFWRVLGSRRNFVARKRGEAAPPGQQRIARRVFLKQSAATLIGASTLALPGYAVCIGPQRLLVRRFQLAIEGLPRSLDNLRVVHLSDTHLGPYVQEAYLHRAIAQANALAPDLIVLTGDYVHRSPLNIKRGIELLGKLRARLGILAVLGNHDHWEGADACREVFRQINIPLIDNSRMFLTSLGLSDSMQASPAEAVCIGVDAAVDALAQPRRARGDRSGDSHRPYVRRPYARRANRHSRFRAADWSERLRQKIGRGALPKSRRTGARLARRRHDGISRPAVRAARDLGNNAGSSLMQGGFAHDKERR